MADDLTAARRLLMELTDLPEQLVGVPADGDLVSMGFNSGDLLRLAVTVEERTGLPLDDDELAALHTLDGIDRVLRAHGLTDTEPQPPQATR